MSNYKLYKECLIKNDSTLKDFAQSVINNLGISFNNDKNYEDFKDESIDIINEHITDDISRTDIDYEDLLYRYRSELGDILYGIDNNGYNIPTISFFGEDAQYFFNEILYYYINIYFEEMVN